MSVHDARGFKVAKIYQADLSVIILEVESALKKLAPYGKYKSVQRIAHTLKDELVVLRAHKTSCETLVQNKGEIAPEGT